MNLNHQALQDRLAALIETLKAKLAFLSKSEYPILAISTGTSGPAGFIEQIEIKHTWTFEELGFQKPTAEGHLGLVHAGILEGVPIIVTRGRLHYCEGYEMWEVFLLDLALCAIGIEHFIFTNASGSMSKDLAVNDIFVVEHHVNDMGADPIRGFPLELVIPGEHIDEKRKFGRYLGQSHIYDGDWSDRCQTQFRLKSGIYVAVSGPSFETPPEIKNKYGIHGDAVGMSLVPNTAAIQHFHGGKAKIIALSLITNLTGYHASKGVTHEDNLAVVKRNDEKFSLIIEGLVEEFATHLAVKV